MVRDGWNFKNDIAMRLEYFARDYFKDIDRPSGKIYDSDSIEAQTFAEVMIILVRQISNYTSENDKVEDFVKQCTPYLGKSGHKIDPEIANHLLDTFYSLVGDR